MATAEEKIQAVRKALIEVCDFNLERIAGDMRFDGRTIPRSEVGDIVTPLMVESMAKTLDKIRRELAS